MKCISDKYKNLLYTSSTKYLESAHMNTTIIVYSLCCALPLNMKERRETKKLCYRATTSIVTEFNSSNIKTSDGETNEQLPLRYIRKVEGY